MLVNDKSLNLMEAWRMGCIHLIGTVNPARSNHADWQFLGFHGVYLGAGSLGSQNKFLIDIKSILLILCRMVRRNIQSFKVIIILFNFRSFNHLITHANENTLHFFQRNGVWMAVAHIALLCRKGDIDDFRL